MYIYTYVTVDGSHFQCVKHLRERRKREKMAEIIQPCHKHESKVQTEAVCLLVFPTLYFS